jgi:hypothetical protein
MPLQTTFFSMLHAVDWISSTLSKFLQVVYLFNPPLREMARFPLLTSLFSGFLYEAENRKDRGAWKLGRHRNRRTTKELYAYWIPNIQQHSFTPTQYSFAYTDTDIYTESDIGTCWHWSRRLGLSSQRCETPTSDCLTPLVAFAVPHAASQATSIGLSVAKTSYPLGTLLMKGILCNWMVCMGEPS